MLPSPISSPSRSTCSPLRTFEALHLFPSFFHLFAGLFRVTLGRAGAFLSLLQLGARRGQRPLAPFGCLVALLDLRRRPPPLRRRGHASETKARMSQLLRQAPLLEQRARLGIDGRCAQCGLELPERRIAVD